MNVEKIISSVASVTRQFGLDQLKPKQIEVILAFVGGRDVFVSLPTGYGKLIMYAALFLIVLKV